MSDGFDHEAWDAVDAVQDDRGIRLRVIGANCAGGGLVALSAVVIGWPGNNVDERYQDDARVSIVVGLAYVLVAVVAADRRARRRSERAFGWTEHRRPPTPAEAASVLGFPWSTALEVMAWWLGGSVLFTALNLWFGNPAVYSVRTGLTIALAGLTTAAVSFLLIERYNRPVFVIALSGRDVEHPRRAAIGRRFVLIWSLGAAVPVLTIATAPAGLTADQHDGLTARLLVVAAIGLGAGFALTVIAARSVADPLDRLRSSVRRVQDGDLEVAVPVDDAGEIGLLQAGFNRMVTGLRERQQLQDLFGRHVGLEVARHALERGVELGGERCEASVLFIDLIGSTTIAQQLPPEDVVGILNAVFTATTQCAAEERGWVNKFEGDAALCIFGPPAGDVDHARHALRAARRLAAAIAELGHAHEGVSAGVGVSTGVVVAGNVGAVDRFEYTVIGDPVNEAARLTELAKTLPGRVVASGAAIAAAADEAANWEATGREVLRGRAEATDTYTPVDQRGAGSR